MRKLTNGDAYQIRRAFNQNPNISFRTLARKYGVDKTTVSRIIRGLSYEDAPGPTQPEAKGQPQLPPSIRKFTPEQVRQIRTRYAQDPHISQQALADEYGVHQKTIREIVEGRSYKDVPGPITTTTLTMKKEVQTQ